jgi:hypothetical protein
MCTKSTQERSVEEEKAVKRFSNPRYFEVLTYTFNSPFHLDFTPKIPKVQRIKKAYF